MKIWISSKRIGVDLDDVLFDFIGELAKFHNKNWGTSFSKRDFESYYFCRLFNCTQEEAENRVRAFLDSDEFKNLSPIDGAVDGINRLVKENNSIFVVTARHERLFDITKMQIKMHFRTIENAPCYFGKNVYTGHGTDTKIDLCRKLKLHYLIEDSPEYTRECSEYAPVLLMRQPWNVEIQPERRIFVVNGWRDVNYMPSKKKF
ncbi:MAG: hypothetical protein QXS38_00675 [Candidatus Pacearchaeota archaeon]